MNKKVLIVAALIASMCAKAQEAASGDDKDKVVKNKKGHEILPKAGDIAIGFNTIPILDLFFGTLSRNPAAPNTNVVQYTNNSNNQIVGKYFLTATSAIRVRLGINTLSGSMINRVQDSKALYDASFGSQDDVNAAQLVRVQDKNSFRKSNVMVSAGYEMRRGYRRLQGVFGGELAFGGTSSSQSTTYGNAFSDQYSVQYTNNFNTYATTNHNPIGGGRQVRNLSTTDRGGFRMGVRGFIGIEYFVFAKISIAAEYGWGWAFTTRTRQIIKQEVYNNGQNGPTVVIEDVNTDSSEKTKGFSVDNNNNNPFSMNNTLGGNTAVSGGAGALTILFHF
jgi:hypothetical protein